MPMLKSVGYLLIWWLMTVDCIRADDAVDKAAMFRKSCWRDSIVLGSKAVSIEQAIPYWIQELESTSIDVRQAAARNLAMAAIAGQIGHTANISGQLLECYAREDVADDVGWEIKLNILTVLSELDESKLAKVLTDERRASEPRLLRIVEMIERKAYLPSDDSTSPDPEHVSTGTPKHPRSGPNKTIAIQGKLMSEQAAIQFLIEAFSNASTERVNDALSDIQRNPRIIKNTAAFDAITNWYFSSAKSPHPSSELKLLRETTIGCIALSEDSRAMDFLRLACEDPDEEIKNRAQRHLKALETLDPK